MVIKRILAVVVVLVILLWLSIYLCLTFEQHKYLEITTEQQQEAEQFLAGKIPFTPENWQWQRFAASPGVELRGGFIPAKNAKATVIVVPGFTGTIEMLMNEIIQFHAAGFNVASVEYRGQGDSYRPLRNPEKGYVEDYSVLAKELLTFAESMREEGKPLLFYSISKGAHITMRMAAEQNPNITAYALTVPMIKLHTGEDSYDSIRRLTAVLNAIGMGKMYAPGSRGFELGKYGEATPCNANPERAHLQSALFALNKSLRTRGITIKWLHETFNSTDKLLTPSYTANIKQPVKLITAGVDLLVDTDAATQFCDSLANCQQIHIESARHCIAEEDMKLYKALIDQVIDFFNASITRH